MGEITRESLTGYDIKRGTSQDGDRLLVFLTRTYGELFPDQSDFGHLAQTVDLYFSWRSPLWWAWEQEDSGDPVAGLWLGNAIDQVSGERYAHIFMVYVDPAHRRRGLATALIHQAQQWGGQRGDSRLGLQVFTHNPGALQLYEKLGFAPRALLLEKRW